MSWHRESARHSLAARGIITTEFGSINRFTGNREGYLYIYDDGEPMGFIDILVDKDKINRIYEGLIPDDVAVVTAIRVYDQYQKSGYGKRLLLTAERYARKFGIKRIWVTSVANEGFFRANGYDRIYHPDLTSKAGTTYEKVL